MLMIAPNALDTDLREWRARLGLTQIEAAQILGRARRQVQEYEAGTQTVPRVVALAMIAVYEHPELRR